LAWTFGREADLAGYLVFRSSTPGGPYTPLNTVPVQHPSYVDRTAPTDGPSYYVVRAVDTSLNQSDPSPEVTSTPLP
jgi:ABC-type oligopeptide transport system substrate-binding subunit